MSAIPTAALHGGGGGGGGGERKPGDRIAQKLELVRQLAEGGMGVLWVARNLSTHAEVAIKVLLPQRSDDEHAAERFRHEAEVGAMLAHRNVTRVFDLLVDDDGALVLVMELLHGRTLEAAYKEKGTLSCLEAVELIVPILGALQHAHDHGVIHRDVKPSNIFLDVDPDGHTTPKVLDFGIAKAQDSSSLTHTGEALGSPKYMSPEQVRANKQLDARSDLFSIGVVLYEIITGENPFDAPSPTAALANVLEVEVDPDPRIEPRLWLEIQRALSKQAYERHDSAKDLADALCRAVGLTAPESLRRPGSAAPSPTSTSAPATPSSAPARATPSSVPVRATNSARPSAQPLPAAAASGKRPAARTAALAAAGAAVVLVVAFSSYGRWSKTDAARSAPGDGAHAADGADAAAASAPVASATADDPPQSVGDLDTPTTTAPRATRGVPRRRQQAPRPAGGGPAGAKAPGAGAATPTASIARTPGF
jgi:serine/threonine protein kinase